MTVGRRVQANALGKAQPLADAQARALLQHCVAECDVREGQPAVPETNGFVVAPAARPQAGQI